MHNWQQVKAAPQVCAYFLEKHDTPKPSLLCLQRAHLVLFSPPLPFFSQPAVQINNKALKWRTETSPMAAWDKSTSNYTTKHCLGFCCLTAIPLSPLLLLNSASLAPQSLHHSSPLSCIFNHRDKQLLLWCETWTHTRPHRLAFPITTCLFLFHNLLTLLLPSSAVFPLITISFLLSILLPLICPIISCLVIIIVSSRLFHHLKFALHITTARHGCC